MRDINKIKKAVIILKIFSILAFAGILTYVIYNYVKTDNVDVWCLCLCIFFMIVIGFAFFTKTFMWNKNSKRNRILLYLFVTLACAIPSVINIICEFVSGDYLLNEDVMRLVNSGLPSFFVGILWTAVILLLYGCICAVIAIYVEKSIIPKNQEMLEEAKAKLQIELAKQEEQRKIMQAQNSKNQSRKRK